MKKANLLHLPRLCSAGIFIFVLSGILWSAGADGASLAVWTGDGQQHVHDLAIVEQLNFTDEELRVVTGYCTHQYSLESITRLDFLDYPTDVEDPDEAADIAGVVHLFQNYPNPFNPETRIRFELSSRGRVKLSVYSVKGELIRTLVEKEMPTGPHSVRWNGRDDSGRSVASGVYFYSLSTPQVKESRKMILLR